MMIGVFRATGQTGSEVVRQLAASGVPVRALVHNVDKARILEGSGVEIMPADLLRPDTLDEALRGIQRAYFVTSGEITQHSSNFYAAARRAGVQHIVRVSGSFMVGPDAPVMFDRWHYQAEKALEESGMAWTHLRPSYFMQNILIQGASGTLALPFADRPVNLVDVRDIAGVVVAALTGNGHEGRTYEVTGPQALTFFAVADRITAVTGRKFNYIPVTEYEFKAALQQWGLPESMAADLAREYGEIGAGHPAFSMPRNTVQQVTGHPARSIDEFARDYAQRLTNPPQWSFTQS